MTSAAFTASTPATVPPRKPTFLEKERWKAIQKALRKGVSLRAIERELGIHRATIKKYRNTWMPTAPLGGGPVLPSPGQHLIQCRYERVTFMLAFDTPLACFADALDTVVGRLDLVGGIRCAFDLGVPAGKPLVAVTDIVQTVNVRDLGRVGRKGLAHLRCATDGGCPVAGEFWTVTVR